MGRPKMLCTSPKGSSAIEATAVRIAIIGAMRYSEVTAVAGRNGSLTASLTASASGWMRP